MQGSLYILIHAHSTWMWSNLISLVQKVANYEYELPEDFKDEEIDEDEAFNEDDEETYGHIFGNKSKRSSKNEIDSEEEDEDAGELTRDDFSDDVSCFIYSHLQLLRAWDQRIRALWDNNKEGGLLTWQIRYICKDIST